MTHQYVNYTFINNALNPYLLGWFYCERGDIDTHAHSNVSPTNSDVSSPNSYSFPLVYLACFCHTSRYISCLLPVTYLSLCCYLLLPLFMCLLLSCVSPTPPFTCLVFITRILSFQLVYKSLCTSLYLSMNINKSPSSSCFCLTLSYSSDSSPTPVPPSSSSIATLLL